jgi:hypothetical protein
VLLWGAGTGEKRLFVKKASSAAANAAVLRGKIRAGVFSLKVLSNGSLTAL